MKTTRSPIILFAVLSIVLSACGSFGPPPECTEGLGGTADEALFAENFNSMQLVNQATGLPGESTEQGEAYAPADTLAIMVDAKNAVTLRACVQFISGRQIAFDQNPSLDAGETEIVLGSFPDTGDYVVRMILDGALVKNFAFVIQ